MANKTLLAAAAAAAFSLAAALPATADEALAKAKGCMACHSVKTKLVGPAYADVAKKYKSDKEAPGKLVTSIMKGSTGKFGPIPMPPNKVTQDEAKKLAAWVLSL
jgi:cytochrome c